MLFFYPKDDTPGCTKEACAFRDAYADFVELGCEVFGISSDASNAHQVFQQKHQLPYPLLSDTQKKVRQLFGVPASLFGLLPGRVSYVVGLDGKVAGIFNSQTNPVGHITEALKVVRNMLTAWWTEVRQQAWCHRFFWCCQKASCPLWFGRKDLRQCQQMLLWARQDAFALWSGGDLQFLAFRRWFL